MVLHPLPFGFRAERKSSAISAWRAVEQKQKQAAAQWWLIAQVDHAVLSGDLAARLEVSAIPKLSEEVVRAISAHDAGWARIDDSVGTAPSAAPGLQPRSFLDIGMAEFLTAWADSINTAEHISAVGGIIVSKHFSRLAGNRLASRNDTAQDVRRLEQFLSVESCRQTRLSNQSNASASELEALTDVLQFCDLVSLYFCCGAEEPVEFPQQFGGTTIRVRRDGDAFLFTPPVFGSGVALGVSARRYPARECLGMLAFLIN